MDSVFRFPCGHVQLTGLWGDVATQCTVFHTSKQTKVSLRVEELTRCKTIKQQSVLSILLPPGLNKSYFNLIFNHCYISQVTCNISKFSSGAQDAIGVMFDKIAVVAVCRYVLQRRAKALSESY